MKLFILILKLKILWQILQYQNLFHFQLFATFISDALDQAFDTELVVDVAQRYVFNLDSKMLNVAVPLI